MSSNTKKLFPFLITVLLFNSVCSQQTANHINNWNIGNGGGISFVSGSPVNVASGMNVYEVSTTYSDGLGNVLFYTGANGGTNFGVDNVVYDASHTLMPNSNILVYYSSSCGLTAAPVPGNCDKYYIFHLGSNGGSSNGLNYSLVDMTLPGNGTIPSPLGDIDPVEKNIDIFSADTLAEKLKIVQKGNTENYWVIVRSLNNDLFYSFEVTSAGINTTPVVSTISATNWPTPIGSPIFSWLAVNKDRNVIAESNGFGPDVKVFSFDNLTGVVGVGETIIPTGTFGSDIPYGIEFSPSGNVLYVNWWEGATNTYISSFDMTVGFGSIGATRQDYTIAVSGSGEYGAMTRAADGKIYSSRNTDDQLIVINDPENYLAPNITSPGYDPGTGNLMIGMPNMSYYNHPDNFIDSLAGGDRVVCPNGQATIGATGNDSIWGTYYWEPSAMVLNPNNATTLTVPLPVNQQFILAVVNNCGDTIKTDTAWVSATCSVLPIELLEFEAECENENVILRWSTGSEINNDYFDVEKSVDGISFSSIGIINGSGNSNNIINYSYNDYELESGMSYYRLKQVDFNGQFGYSGIVGFQKCYDIEGGIINTFYNTSNQFVVDYMFSKSKKVSLALYDVQGKRIIEKEIMFDQNQNQIKIPIYKMLDNAIYMVRIISDDSVYTKKIIISK